MIQSIAMAARFLPRARDRGRGATFTVTLHLADDDVASKEFSVTTEPDNQDQPIRILLVDDHEDTRVMYARILKRSGYEVQSASNYTDALRFSENNHFDIIISDLGLPDGNGHDLMRQIRQREPSAKGIALSGYGMESDVERSMEAGFEVHLTKPVEYTALVEAMQRVLAK